MLNKVSNLLMLVQILILNILAIIVGVSIYHQSKIVAIISFIAVIALFFLNELKFFNRLNVWHSSLKKELRYTPLFDNTKQVFVSVTEFGVVPHLLFGCRRSLDFRIVFE